MTMKSIYSIICFINIIFFIWLVRNYNHLQQIKTFWDTAEDEQMEILMNEMKEYDAQKSKFEDGFLTPVPCSTTTKYYNIADNLNCTEETCPFFNIIDPYDLYDDSCDCGCIDEFDSELELESNDEKKPDNSNDNICDINICKKPKITINIKPSFDIFSNQEPEPESTLTSKPKQNTAETKSELISERQQTPNPFANLIPKEKHRTNTKPKSIYTKKQNENVKQIYEQKLKPEFICERFEIEKPTKTYDQKEKPQISYRNQNPNPKISDRKNQPNPKSIFVKKQKPEIFSNQKQILNLIFNRKQDQIQKSDSKCSQKFEKTSDFPRQPEKTSVYKGKPEKTPEYPGKPGKTSELPRNPEKTSEFPGKPEKTSEFPGKPAKTSECPGKPEKTSELPGKPEKTSDFNGKPDNAHNFNEKSDKTSFWSKKLEKISDLSKTLEKASDFSVKPEKSSVFDENPEKTSDFDEKSEKTSDFKFGVFSSVAKPQVAFTVNIDVESYRKKIFKSLKEYFKSNPRSKIYCDLTSLLSRFACSLNNSVAQKICSFGHLSVEAFCYGTGPIKKLIFLSVDQFNKYFCDKNTKNPIVKLVCAVGNNAFRAAYGVARPLGRLIIPRAFSAPPPPPPSRISFKNPLTKYLLGYALFYTVIYQLISYFEFGFMDRRR